MKKNAIMLFFILLTMSILTTGCFSEPEAKKAGIEKMKEIMSSEKRATATVVKNGVYVTGTTTIMYTFAEFVELSTEEGSKVYANPKAYIVYKDRYIDLVTFFTDINVNAGSFSNGTNGVKAIVDETVIPINVKTKSGENTTSRNGMTYMVTFNSNGGTAVTALTNISNNATITEPTPPTKAGSIFGGWYKEARFLNEWNFGVDKVTKDITLYAKWSNNYSQVSSNGNYSMFLKKDGTLLAIGTNQYGNYGNGTSNASSINTEVIMNDVANISTFFTYTMIVKKDGSLWATGSNTYGRFGNGTTKNSSTFVKITDNVSSVFAGRYATMILKNDGTLWATGNNSYGMFGIGSSDSSLFPIEIMDNVDSVSIGDSHTMVVKKDGTLWASGYNYYGQLGDKTYANNTNFVKVLDNVLSVKAGRFFTLVIKRDSTLWVTGKNEYGQLGINGKEKINTFEKILDGVNYVDAGESHTLIIKNDGSLWVCGYNYYGQLGDGTKIKIEVPTSIATNVTYAKAGNVRSFIIKKDGTIWGCGDNSFGSIDGNNLPSSGTTIFTKISILN